MRRLDLSSLLLALTSILAGIGSAAAIDRDLGRALRDRYEGHTLRLRLDLRSAAHAVEPNVLGLEGIGYGRESSPVLFNRLETVYVERVTSEGGSRVGLTVYRSEEEMRRLRSSAIPAPITGIPGAMQPQAAFSRQGSTSVILELQAGKKDAAAQREEIDILLKRLFYIDADPTRQEIEQFILEHRTMPVGRLASTTGLSGEEVRRVLEEAAP
jgi:hypothetical protein